MDVRNKDCLDYDYGGRSGQRSYIWDTHKIWWKVGYKTCSYTYDLELDSIWGVRERELSYLGDLHLDQCYSKYWGADFVVTGLWRHKLVPKCKAAEFLLHSLVFSRKEAAHDLNSSTSSFFCHRPERVSRPDSSVALTLRNLASDRVTSENLYDPVLRVIQVWHVLELLIL